MYAACSQAQTSISELTVNPSLLKLFHFDFYNTEEIDFHGKVTEIFAILPFPTCQLIQWADCQSISPRYTECSRLYEFLKLTVTASQAYQWKVSFTNHLFFFSTISISSCGRPCQGCVYIVEHSVCNRNFSSLLQWPLSGALSVSLCFSLRSLSARPSWRLPWQGPKLLRRRSWQHLRYLLALDSVYFLFQSWHSSTYPACFKCRLRLFWEIQCGRSVVCVWARTGSLDP